MGKVLDKLKRVLKYNWPQACFVFFTQLYKVLEWGRGTGKSTIIAKHIIDCVTQMPRATGVLAGETYMQIKTRTLPSTIAGLEQHGWYKDIYFFVGQKPPKDWKWPEPYESITDYKYSIIFWNGCVINMVSQDGGASGRGMNVDFVIADEAVRLKKQWFDTDILLTNRGNRFRVARYPDGTKEFFKDCSLHHSVLLASTTPLTQEGMWFLEYEKLAKQFPKKYAFIRASAEDNRANLGDDYFDNAKKTMPDFIYNAEVLNIRVKKIQNGFYPLLKEHPHTYTNFNNEYFDNHIDAKPITCQADADLNPALPLLLGIDWGATINCMVVSQLDPEENILRFIKNLFVLSPQIIDDLIHKFIEYYEPQRLVNNKVNVFYDPTGNVAQANSRLTNAQLVQKLLSAAGWNVQLLTPGKYNIQHEEKFTLWNELLKGTRPDLPQVLINKSNCNELWISMTNTPARIGSTEAIKKDKSSETKTSVKPEHATHFGDACDTIPVGLYYFNIKTIESYPAAGVR